MPSKYVKQKNFERNTRLIEAFCDENKIKFEKLNNGYQIRLEEMIDLYPVRGRWHNLKTGERGDWMGYKDLRRVMLAALEMISTRPGIHGVSIVEVDNGVLNYPDTDGETTIEVKPEDTYPITKLTPEMFYKKPRWWQWRKKRYYQNLLKTK